MIRDVSKRYLTNAEIGNSLKLIWKTDKALAERELADKNEFQSYKKKIIRVNPGMMLSQSFF
jgi:hypothetical protein